MKKESAAYLGNVFGENRLSVESIWNDAGIYNHTLTWDFGGKWYI